MLTVDSCLCCRLETGGLIIGWLTLIGNILGALGCLAVLCILCAFNCDELSQKTHMNSQQLDLCNSFHGVLIGVFAVLILFCIGIAYIGWKCIQGTRARDHFRVKPMMILLIIGMVFSVLQILPMTASGIVHGLINFVVNGYCYVVIYSLYTMFRQEYENIGNRQPLQHRGKV